jgi:hypothetical protein
MTDYYLIIGTKRGCGKTKRAIELASEYGKYIFVCPSDSNEDTLNLIKEHKPKAIIIELTRFEEHSHFEIDAPEVAQIYTIHAPEFKGFELNVEVGSIELEIL